MKRALMILIFGVWALPASASEPTVVDANAPASLDVVFEQSSSHETRPAASPPPETLHPESGLKQHRPWEPGSGERDAEVLPPDTLRDELEIPVQPHQQVAAPVRDPRQRVIDPRLALPVVLVIIALCAWFFRRAGGARKLNGQTAMQVLTRTTLAPRQSIALVRVGRRVLMLGVAPERISSLLTIDDPTEVEMLCASGGLDGNQPRFEPLLKSEALQFAESQVAPVEDEPAVLQAREQVRTLSARLQQLAATTLKR